MASKTIFKVQHHFDIIEGSDPSLKIVIYKYCKQDYLYAPKTLGTSNLWTQLNKLCKQFFGRFKFNDKKQKTLAQTFKGVKDETRDILHVINFSQKVCRKTLCRIIIYDEFPFRIEKGLGFKQFFQAMQHGFYIPSQITITNGLSKPLC